MLQTFSRLLCNKEDLPPTKKMESHITIVPLRCFKTKRELLYHVGIRYEFLSELEAIVEETEGDIGDVTLVKIFIKKHLMQMMQYYKGRIPAAFILYGIGFTGERTQALSKILESPLSCHRSLLCFVNNYIENCIHRIFFPLSMKSIPVFITPPSTASTTVLFHSTSRIHAQNIVNKGIQTSIGEACQDFSHNGGFYLTDNIQFAYMWATMRSVGAEAAILVYTIPKQIITMFKGLHLHRECANDMLLWKQIIEYNTSGRIEHKQNIDVLYNTDTSVHYQKHVDYIEGPVGSYGGKSMYFHVNQMCILTQHMADALCLENNKYLYQVYDWCGVL